MNFTEYQAAATETAVYPDRGKNLYYPALGLNGESGEVAEKVKKLMRDHGGIITDDIAESIAKELGDCLWYISETATQIGASLDDIAKANIEKLASRQKRGAIQGDGDNR
jgi:NTP pyrophosphatase (non-canonical NTP hydrolase)